MYSDHLEQQQQTTTTTTTAVTTTTIHSTVPGTVQTSVDCQLTQLR